MRQVLLLGGTGFIGSEVLRALRGRPDLRLMVLGHRSVDYRALEDVNLVVSGLQDLDLEWLETFRPDTIIHLARLPGRGRVGRSWAARRGSRANQRLIRWLATNSPETHVVYVSGTLVYGDCGEADTDEKAELRPVSFAREYILAETPWMEAQRDGVLPVTLVRPPWVVGSGSWFHHYYARPALQTGKVPIYGSGRNWMSLLDVTDCAGAIVHVAERAKPGSTFNLFTPGQMTRQADFAEFVSLATGTRLEPPGHVSAPDSATGEALTFSFRAATIHPEPAMGYAFGVKDWRDMVSRHLPAA